MSGKSRNGQLWSLVADLVCVLALAIGGKGTHEASDPMWVVLAIAWPFVLATTLVHGWLASRARETRRLWPEGVTVLAVTYGLGMLLRAISGRGMDPAFLVVAGAFLAATMLGWRGAARLLSTGIDSGGGASENSIPRS